MILVTGTKRSGTSLWMQILEAGGLEIVGSDFPSTWGDSIRDANPRGFYESRLREGIYFATNPDPETGAYLHPARTQQHAVKVFVPGLVRTDHAFLFRVVASIRHWRSYGLSLERLYAEEDAWLLANPSGGQTGEEAVASAQQKRSPLPPPIQWFLQNFDLVRDWATRQYPVYFGSYDRLLDDPERVLTKVFGWLGKGDPAAALAAIEPSLRRSDPNSSSEDWGVDPELLRVCDAFYAAIHQSSTLEPELLTELNQTWLQVVADYGMPTSLLGDGMS